MPETTCLVPMPSSSLSFKSFWDFSSFSHSKTFAARSSTFANSSMAISSASGFTSAFGSPPFAFSSSIFALTASISAFSSSIIFFESILAKSGTASPTFVPAAYPPNAQSVSSPSRSVFICASIFSDVSGIIGLIIMPINLIVSISSYKTVTSRDLPSSVLASAHGSVSSMYLFARLASAKTSAHASANLNASKCALKFFAASKAFASSSKSSSVLSCGASTYPPKYLFTIATVRFTRFPIVFARSVLYLSITAS